jgi:hypothetical protein
MAPKSSWKVTRTTAFGSIMLEMDDASSQSTSSPSPVLL